MKCPYCNKYVLKVDVECPNCHNSLILAQDRYSGEGQYRSRFKLLIKYILGNGAYLKWLGYEQEANEHAKNEVKQAFGLVGNVFGSIANPANLIGVFIDFFAKTIRSIIDIVLIILGLKYKHDAYGHPVCYFDPNKKVSRNKESKINFADIDVIEANTLKKFSDSDIMQNIASNNYDVNNNPKDDSDSIKSSLGLAGNVTAILNGVSGGTAENTVEQTAGGVKAGGGITGSTVAAGIGLSGTAGNNPVEQMSCEVKTGIGIAGSTAATGIGLVGAAVENTAEQTAMGVKAGVGRTGSTAAMGIGVSGGTAENTAEQTAGGEKVGVGRTGSTVVTGIGLLGGTAENLGEQTAEGEKVGSNTLAGTTIGAKNSDGTKERVGLEGVGDDSTGGSGTVSNGQGTGGSIRNKNRKDREDISIRINRSTVKTFGIILGTVVLCTAVYFVFLKPDAPKVSPITDPTPITNPAPTKSIIPKIEEAKERHNGSIASIATLINDTVNKKGNLKGETELLNSAMRVEQEVLDTLAELRNSNEANTRKGRMLIRILQAEQKRISGLVDGLRAGVNGLDYQAGFKSGSEGYYEYDRLNSEYMYFETGDFKPQMAYVNGDDVFLRSAPSTNSSVIKTLKRNSGLDAIAVQTCDDERAGMINTDNVVVGFNGQNIRLAKGQPVTITGENGSTYQCQLNLENGSGTIYVDKVNVKKLYGETWYKVRLAGGTEGWVYKDFIQLKRDL